MKVQPQLQWRPRHTGDSRILGRSYEMTLRLVMARCFFFFNLTQASHLGKGTLVEVLPPSD